nr:hypothetical protein [Tanacetum cinerariifolium]
MSSASSAVTYTSVYTDSEPWRPQDLNYVPEPIYPEYIPLKDEHVLLVEEHPLPLVDSPTAESLRYVAESDPEEDPEEYEDDESEDGPVDYPINGGDDGDDDDGDSCNTPKLARSEILGSGRNDAVKRSDKWWLPTVKVPHEGLSEDLENGCSIKKIVSIKFLAIKAKILAEMEIPENHIENLHKLH